MLEGLGRLSAERKLPGQTVPILVARLLQYGHRYVGLMELLLDLAEFVFEVLRAVLKRIVVLLEYGVMG